MLIKFLKYRNKYVMGNDIYLTLEESNLFPRKITCMRTVRDYEFIFKNNINNDELRIFYKNIKDLSYDDILEDLSDYLYECKVNIAHEHNMKIENKLRAKYRKSIM